MSCMSIVGSHFRSLIQIFSNDILWNQNVLQVVDVFAEGGHDMTCEGGHDTWTDALSASVVTKCWAAGGGPICWCLFVMNCHYILLSIITIMWIFLLCVRITWTSFVTLLKAVTTIVSQLQLTPNSFLFSNNWKKGNKNSMLKGRHFVMHAFPRFRDLLFCKRIAFSLKIREHRGILVFVFIFLFFLLGILWCCSFHHSPI